jgi:hypothetical protein
MRRFSPVTGIWGLSRIDADDQARYFLDIDEYVAPCHLDGSHAYGEEPLREIAERLLQGPAVAK